MGVPGHDLRDYDFLRFYSNKEYIMFTLNKNYTVTKVILINRYDFLQTI